MEIQLSHLKGLNKVTSTGSADVKLGLAEDVLVDTNFTISSNCLIESSIDEIMVCQKRKNLFEVKRILDRLTNKLEVSVTNGKSVEINKMSWIDFIKYI